MIINNMFARKYNILSIYQHYDEKKIMLDMHLFINVRLILSDCIYLGIPTLPQFPDVGLLQS